MNNKITLMLASIFVVMFSNAAVSEAQTMKNEGLNAKQKSIVPIAAFTASGDMEKLKTALNEGLDAGLTVNEIKEVLIQMYAYAGFPRSLNGIDAFMGVLEEREKKGIKDESGKEPGPMPADKSSIELGTEIQTAWSENRSPGRFTRSPPPLTVLERTPLRRHLRTRQPGFPEQGDCHHLGPGQHEGSQSPAAGSLQHRVECRADRGPDEEPDIRSRSQSRQERGR